MATDATKWILSSTILVGLLAFIFYPLVGPSELETWLNKEYTLSKTKLLANIGPKGSRAQGAHAGVIIASPSDGSNDEPDYVYTWTRDAALVMQKIVDLYVVCRLGLLYPHVIFSHAVLSNSFHVQVYFGDGYLPSWIH